MKTVYETSCGVVLWTGEKSEPKFLLLHYPGGHWDFPKGHVEPSDANQEATALRELEEETGITEVTLDPEFKTELRYIFRRGPHERVDKVVHFFLAHTDETKIELSHEHQDYDWMTHAQALETLTFKNAKEVLKAAHAHMAPENNVES